MQSNKPCVSGANSAILITKPRKPCDSIPSRSLAESISSCLGHRYGNITVGVGTSRDCGRQGHDTDLRAHRMIRVVGNPRSKRQEQAFGMLYVKLRSTTWERLRKRAVGYPKAGTMRGGNSLLRLVAASMKVRHTGTTTIEGREFSRSCPIEHGHL